MSFFKKDYFKDGEAFESYVEHVIFPSTHFKLLEKTHNYQQNASRYVESSLKPDFKFRSLATGREFYVEAKFRSRYNKEDKLELLKFNQYQRYKQHDAPEHPVFILVGTEGNPDRPKQLSLIPFSEIEHLELYRSFVYKHRIPASVCPENALTATSSAKINPTQSSPHLSDIASGLTYKKATPKRTNYLVWLLGFLVIAVFSAFLITQVSSNPKVESDPLKDKIQAYYKTIEHNNTEALDYYLNDHLDRWYDKPEVSLSVVKKDADAYNKRYPTRHLEIDWPTYKVNTLPNGDYNVSYNVKYRIKPVKSEEYLFFQLAIKSIWDKDMKIKSMYEERLK